LEQISRTVDITLRAGGLRLMKPLSKFRWLALAAAVALAGCESSEDLTDNREVLTSSDKPLSFPQPVTRAGGGGTGKWTAIPRDGGAEYVQVLGDMEDVVSFYGFWSAVAPEIRTFDDMERLMRADTSFGFRSLRRGTILGVPVLWFEKTATESGVGSEKLAILLGAKPRRPEDTYHVRTRGVFMLQQAREPRFVTIACARTSTHGELGSFYEGQFTAWLTSIVENCFL
jgi:hypothetical protein